MRLFKYLSYWMWMPASTDYSRRPHDFSPGAGAVGRPGLRAVPGRAIRIAGLLILAVLLAPAGPARGASLPEFLTQDPDQPWEIQAETVEYDAVRKVYVARDGVVIRKDDKRLSARQVTFDHKNMTASAEGNVMMTTGEDILTGERIDIDLEKETGTIHQGKVFSREKNFHIRGERIEKTGRNEYRVREASVTTCDGETPAWRITARNLDVTLEGYGRVKDGTFWVKNIPIAYSPYFIFPVKRDRQTGLLFPEFGSSDRKGVSYNQPLFWAISESQDATFYNYFMSDRGDKVGAEYRYVLDERSKGTFMLDYLHDRKIDDGTGSSSADWGYEGDGYLRPNHDRYWFRAKINQALPLDVTSRLDLDIVSDQDYLYEFQDGHSGFDATRKYFNQHFGREIDDYTDPIRTNSLNLNRIWSAYSFNAEALWYDNVLNRRWEETDPTLQRLPLVSLNSVRQGIRGMPLYWSMESNYAYFYRQDGDKGHRLDIWPRLSMPRRFKEYLFLEPSVGVRETLWNVNGDDTALEGPYASSDENRHREMFDARVDLFTRLSRVYSLAPDGGGLLSRLNLRPEKIRHHIRPEFVYEFVPDRNQDEYPFFDPADRVARKNRATFSLVNTWVSKSKRARKASEPGATGTELHPAVDYAFRQFCRFEVSQSYDADIYAADDLIYEYDLTDRTTPEPGEHLSPFYARLDVEPADFYTVSADMQWSHLEDAFLSGNIALTLRDRRGDYLYTEYRSTRDANESFYASLQARITSWLSTYAEYEQNIRDSENIKTGVGFIYTHPCWSMDLRFLKDRDDEAFGVMINLAGLGGTGFN